MSTPPDAPSTMAWFPATVGSAYRRGAASDEDLISGAAFEAMVAGLRGAADLVGSARAPTSPIDRAAGYRHLLVLLSLAIDEALRPSDPYDPFFAPANVDAVLKWGMDCPDAAYTGAALRGDATYRVRGRRGTVRYLGFQVMSGIESSVNVVADDLDIAADGSFEITLSAIEHPGNWMALSERTSSLVVRQFFYDWDTEVPAELQIECLEPGPSWPDPQSLSPAGVARQLAAIGEFLEASIAFWLDVEEGGRAQGINVFRQPASLTTMGAAAENVSVWGSWELDENQALVIEVTPPNALYWSVSLGNHWWETIDYANRQSSLNGHQAVIDDDGVFRAVVAHTDPGVANWLDTAGHRQGPMIFRWVRAEGAPVPTTHVGTMDQLVRALPSGTARLDPVERRAALGRRRAAVRRRFPR
jgi:hypothetical protein